MRRILCSALLVCYCVSPAWAEEVTPRSIVERALEAQGGKELFTPVPCAVYRVRAKLHDKTLPNVQMTGKLYQGNGKSRADIGVTVAGTTIQMVQAFDGKNAWMQVNDKSQPVPTEQLQRARASALADRITSLTPLLSDTRYKMTYVAKTKVREKPAHHIEVRAKEMPTVSLYFEIETGQLIQTRYEPMKGKVVQTYYWDYQEVDTAKADKNKLAEAKIGLDPMSLLAYLKRQVPKPVDRKAIEKLIADLGSDSFDDRENAQDKLEKLGAVIVPFLEKSVESDDPEVVRRSQELLEGFTKQMDEDFTGSVVRVLGHLLPEGTTATLLALVPSAKKELRDEMLAVLFTIAQKSKGNDKALLEGLDSKVPEVRAACRQALGKDGSEYAKQPGRRLYLRGIKFPTKQETSSEDKATFEILEVEFFSSFPDSLFEDPAKK